MTLQEIQKAITELSANELVLFRKWLEQFERDAESRKLNALQPATEEHLKNLKGSLKGKGLLKALMAEKKREREL